jgi:phage shock protein C
MANYCSSCGKPIATGSQWCPNCGHSVGGAFAGSVPVSPSFAQRRLVRPRAGRKIAGVCQGIANMYGWDVMLVRVLFVVAAFFGLGGLVVYVIVWLIAPEEAYALPQSTGYPPAPPG